MVTKITEVVKFMGHALVKFGLADLLPLGGKYANRKFTASLQSAMSANMARILALSFTYADPMRQGPGDPRRMKFWRNMSRISRSVPPDFTT